MKRAEDPVSPQLKGLWIAREIPFPLDSGDRIYTARLLRSLAEAGARITFTGFANGFATADRDWPVNWMPVKGARRGKLQALCSTMPLVAATHATAQYRKLIEELARQPWDFVVIDQYGMGWALPIFHRRAVHSRPVLVHVAHDHEASVYASLVRGFRGSPLKRLALRLNWLKTSAFEQRIARSVDLITAITDEDAVRFGVDAPQIRCIVLKPGYAGTAASRSGIGSEVPRNVVMVGSYQWVAKQENLRRFVAAADNVFFQHGITLHVIGAMPQALAAELRSTSRAVVLHGFVDDIRPHFANARLAAVPEEIGGGFKLKFLDYIFGRVAVATLDHAAAGLPDAIRGAMICRDDIDSLVQAIATAIEDTAALSAMQNAAFAAAQELFRWSDRGRDLLTAIAAQGQRAASGRGT